MKVTLKMLLVGLAVVMGLSAGPVLGQERGPGKMLDLTKGLDLHVDQVLEGSEEIKPGEDMGGPTPRGIWGMVIVHNYTPYIVDVFRGSKCNNFLGVVLPYTIMPLAVGDWPGNTKLCAYGVKARGKAPVKDWYQTVTGKHATYQWMLR